MKAPTQRMMDVVESIYGTILFLFAFTQLALGNYVVAGWVFSTIMFFLLNTMSRNLTEEYSDLLHKCNDLLGRSLSLNDELTGAKRKKSNPQSEVAEDVKV